MNIAMQLTVDQLVRSLRSIAHGVADRIDVRTPKHAVKSKLTDQRTDARKEQADERRR